ncbi:MAG TPA: aldose epimerase family protein [Flavobacteriaceae bacterium]|nr:galactose mutarotase [Flavobacteriaceae bacterium]MCB9213762.1 galactose mutarotase [Alteromonas sp.]HPF11321.1 aldose epimerase family protein [Flavobacteriaceae bacterium]HQU22164.1 aldose epimerase family protein [Flavobacteriaceae bacterium]HQU64460.1 aldose epimerase family protein [Flavobacteriaceae bacterium]
MLELTTIVLQTPKGLRAEITNYGATLMRLQVLDKHGNLVDVVAGLPEAKDYESPLYQKQQFYLGATVGRYAGRISHGGFELEGTFFEITHKDGVQLHGGVSSLDKQLWKVDSVADGSSPSVLFSTTSEAGHNGFPGNLKVFAKYELIDTELRITYTATTDAPTVLNLTNHAYFNLNGKGSVEGHQLQVKAPHILEVDERLVPTGRLVAVVETPYDYQKMTHLTFDGHYGLDTPFVLTGPSPQATLFSEATGIVMEVRTNQPAMVLFTPQDFGIMQVRDKAGFKRFPAICLECQNFPDAPNQPQFPSAVLRPGAKYMNEISFVFSTK